MLTFILTSPYSSLLATFTLPPSLDSCNSICYFTTFASALNITTVLFLAKGSYPRIKAFTVPVSSPRTSLKFLPTYVTEITFTIRLRSSSPGSIAATLVNFVLGL